MQTGSVAVCEILILINKVLFPLVKHHKVRIHCWHRTSYLVLIFGMKNDKLIRKIIRVPTDEFTLTIKAWKMIK